MNSLVNKVYKIKPHRLDLDALRDATPGFASAPYLTHGSLSCEQLCWCDRSLSFVAVTSQEHDCLMTQMHFHITIISNNNDNTMDTNGKNEHRTVQEKV